MPEPQQRSLKIGNRDLASWTANQSSIPHGDDLGISPISRQLGHYSTPIAFFRLRTTSHSKNRHSKNRPSQRLSWNQRTRGACPSSFFRDGSSPALSSVQKAGFGCRYRRFRRRRLPALAATVQQGNRRQPRQRAAINPALIGREMGGAKPLGGMNIRRDKDRRSWRRQRRSGQRLAVTRGDRVEEGILA